MAEHSARALKKAQRVRTEQAALRRSLEARHVDPVALLRGNADDASERVARDMKLEKLLMRIPGIGEVTVEELLEEAGLRRTHTLAVLTFEKRGELADALHLALYGEPPLEVPDA